MSKYDDAYWQEMIDEIMDEFDFDRVNTCMVALNWRWASSDGVPDRIALRKCARRLLHDCVDKGYGGTGGFQVTIDRENGCLSLLFVVEEWDAHKEETNAR